jgi:hypothetical protein
VDLRRDATHAQIEREIENMNLGPIDGMMNRWTFRRILLKSAYSAHDMESMVAQTPFGQGKIDVGNVGFQVSLVK